MTKRERRQARKTARAAHQRLVGELAIEPPGNGHHEFSETPGGYGARHRWAEWYDSLNGAPEGEWDR